MKLPKYLSFSSTLSPSGRGAKRLCRWSPARIGRAAVRVSCRPRITTGPRSISRADLSEVFALFLIYSQSGWSMEFIGGVEQKTFLHAVFCARCALRVNKRARQFRLANFLDPRHSVHPRPVQHYSESSERWVCRNDQGYSRGSPGFTAPARRFCVPEVTWACYCNCDDSASAASIAGLRGGTCSEARYAVTPLGSVPAISTTLWPAAQRRPSAGS
jgi:hypothetical protein